jgi:twitching motility two-component system response regulator PilH
MKAKKILVIDDSDLERQRVVKYLAEAGYDVAEAASGEEGVQRAIESLPNLIIMDVMMPGVNGFQATRHLKKSPETSNIPVIMLTSRTQDTDKAWALKQGAEKYFVKPANRVLLLEAVADLLTVKS